jgi:hypothetical protein
MAAFENRCKKERGMLFRLLAMLVLQQYEPTETPFPKQRLLEILRIRDKSQVEKCMSKLQIGWGKMKNNVILLGHFGLNHIYSICQSLRLFEGILIQLQKLINQ